MEYEVYMQLYILQNKLDICLIQKSLLNIFLVQENVEHNLCLAHQWLFMWEWIMRNNKIRNFPRRLSTIVLEMKFSFL